MTFSAPIFVRARFINAATRRDQGADRLHGRLPYDDGQGHLRDQRHRARRCVAARPQPGVIFEPGERYRLRNLTKHQLVKGTIHPYRGEWMELDVEQRPGKDVTAGTGSPASAAGIFTLLTPSASTRPTPRASWDPSSSSSRVSGEKDREVAPSREEALVEQACPPRRTALGRVARGRLRQRVLREPPLRTCRGRSLQAHKLGSQVAKVAEQFVLHGRLMRLSPVSACSICPASTWRW